MDTIETENAFLAFSKENGAAFPGIAESSTGEEIKATPEAAFAAVEEKPEEEEIELLGAALAKGLPDWNIEPPHALVRRKKA